MSQTFAIWALVLLALVAANLPFVNQRFLMLVPLPSGRKPLAVRLLELIILYFVVGAAGLYFEQRAGQIYPQDWEFYAVTASLFLTLAFPGFVYRYLIRHGHG